MIIASTRFRRISRIVKAEMLDELGGDNVSNFKLVNIDSAKCENPVYPELVKLPTATKALLKSLVLPVDKKTSILKRMQSQCGCINQEVARKISS